MVGGGANAPPPGSNPGSTIYGMEKPGSRERALAQSRLECDLLKDEGFVLRKLFVDTQEGKTWEKGSDLRDVTGDFYKRVTGPDPSKDGKEVFGTNINRYDELDRQILPSDTPSGEVEGYYDGAADILSLPGGYHMNEDGDGEEDHKATEVLVAMAQGHRETGLHMRYGAAGNNALKSIKSKDDLADFMEDLHEAWEEAEYSMTSQITRQMHRLGFSMKGIEGYLQAGLLTRVVRDTHKYYVSFLNTLTGYVNRMTVGEAWKNSVAYLVLTHHTEKLALIRRTSSSYRDLVLGNYAYMQDQQTTAFWNSKLN